MSTQVQFVNAFDKQDLIAFVATLTMFLGVLLLPSTPLGLLPICAGALIMLIVLLKVVRKNH